MKKWYVIGVMSGTSLDGLDIAYCSFFKKNKMWKYKIIHAETLKYNEKIRKILKNAHKLNAKNFLVLHKKYGVFIGKKIKEFIKNKNIKKVDIISSHGHTIFHEPIKRFNFQLGEGAFIAATTNITTVSDFRTLDIAFGGQGAPLVPIGDHLLFYNYKYCLNLGGFCNVSYVFNKKRIAFDIAPCNFLLNFYSSKINCEYDHNGNLSKSGIVIQQLLTELNNIEYYKLPPPKSLAREMVEKYYIPIITKYETFPIPDILATLVEHISYQISKILIDGNTLVTGGGAFNEFLISKIQEKTNSKLVIPDEKLIKFKEALIFAFLGLLRIKNKLNTLKSVTGSKKNLSAGVIYKV